MGVRLHVFNEAIRQFVQENDDAVQRIIPIMPDQAFHLLFLHPITRAIFRVDVQAVVQEKDMIRKGL